MFRHVAVLSVVFFCHLLLRAALPAAIAAPPLVKVAPQAVTAKPPSTALVEASGAILMDRQTGVVLWAHNPDLELPMASTTKMMTAMVILDHGAQRLNEKVKVSRHAASVGGSSQFGQDDVVALGDLLKAALIRSSNESTVAAAEYLAGSEQGFVDWMNEKATQLGLKHTHFVNPNGLYDKVRGNEHYSTARDLATIARCALTYPLIREIVRMGRDATGRAVDVRVFAAPRGWVMLSNRDKILNQPVPGVPGSVVDGVKTGYVKESGKCLVSSATCNGWQLIAVVLNSTEMYKDNLALFHYGFTRFAWRTLASEEREGARVPVLWGSPGKLAVGTFADNTLGAPVAKMGSASKDEIRFVGKRLRAPIRKGQQVGMLELHRNGRVLLAVPAVAMHAVAFAWWTRALLGLVFLLVFVVCFILLDRYYGTSAKDARCRRRLLKEASRKADPGGASDH